jgi:hypothetical protein
MMILLVMMILFGAKKRDSVMIGIRLEEFLAPQPGIRILQGWSINLTLSTFETIQSTQGLKQTEFILMISLA